MSVTIRPASEADVAFLTTVVIEATLDQGRLPDNFDEVDSRAGFGEWTSEQIGGDGVVAEARASGLLVELGVEKDNPRARVFWERCGFTYVGEDETEHWLRLAT